MNVYDIGVILIVVIATVILILSYKHFDRLVNRVIMPKQSKLSEQIFKYTLFYSISGYDGFIEDLRGALTPHLQSDEGLKDKAEASFYVTYLKDYSVLVEMLGSKNGLQIKVIDAKAYGSMIHKPERILRVYQLLDREIKNLSPRALLSLHEAPGTKKSHKSTLKEDIERHHLL